MQQCSNRHQRCRPFKRFVYYSIDLIVHYSRDTVQQRFLYYRVDTILYSSTSLQQLYGPAIRQDRLLLSEWIDTIVEPMLHTLRNKCTSVSSWRHKPHSIHQASLTATECTHNKYALGTHLPERAEQLISIVTLFKLGCKDA